ncbi:hypothetical protein BBJ29_006892 [Phytophthora kernoviae]|uniref:Peptidase S54 rhomboid domain-containing protein n=1 Tax=Phytophthora kernoviae TaxID=325452 RepID=A0A3F2RU12_9STRA|nr:hypothetical protein BBP00_00003593 [Phytophthora kernoviae]RLN69042.1 hypothetical protein BBJ29_006892 [Phytophthora kernoviae]
MLGPNLGRRGRNMGRHVGGNGQSVALMLMLMQNIQRLERKPPVTLGLMDKVINNWDLKRIIGSGLIHVDDWHLYHNMISFLWKGYHLEYKLGNVHFLLTVGFLLVICHVLVIVVALVLATCFQIQVRTLAPM